MNDFWKSDVYAVIKAMKATGNQPGIIRQWIEAARLWADSNTDADALALRAWLPLWQERPFYTAAELAPMFSAMIVGLGLSKYLPPRLAPKRLEHLLEYGGLPYLVFSEGETPTKFFIVEQIHRWQNREITQQELDDVFRR